MNIDPVRRRRWRRVGWTVAGAIVGLVLAAVLAFVAVLSGYASPADGIDVGGVARAVRDGRVSLFVIPTRAGRVALVDAGNDPQGKALLAELRRRHLGLESVEAVLLTHGHRDHIAACPLVPQARIVALEAELPLLEGRARARGLVPRFLPRRRAAFRVSQPVHDGDVLTIGERTVRVFAVPGHTAGSAAYLVDGVLFVGDSAMLGTDGRVRPAVSIFTDDGAQNVRSLRALGARLSATDVRFLAFAHTGVAELGAAALAAVR